MFVGVESERFFALSVVVFYREDLSTTLRFPRDGQFL